MMRREILLRSISRRKLLIASIIAFFVFINEFLIYRVQAWRWPAVPRISSRKDEMRVIFVADPQLIGHMFEPRFGIFTRWDIDRFLSTTFGLAYDYVQPDVVIFMGDLLDEGSVTTDDMFDKYARRFFNIFKKAPKSDLIFMHGDNDVGGEGNDPKTIQKIKRFEKYFGIDPGVVSKRFLDFVKINYDFPINHPDDRLKELSEISKGLSKPYRIIVNHQSILMRAHSQIASILEKVKPNLIMSAHMHSSDLIECRDCYTKGSQGNYVKADDLVTVDMNIQDKLYEIRVPTCSYRMGMQDMGYGVGTISNNGIVKYTVLWLPHRLTVLYSYLFFLAVVLIGCVFFQMLLLLSRGTNRLISVMPFQGR